MADEQTQKFCPNCQRNVVAQRPKTNHILHFLITVFTCGAWVVVWILVSIKFGGWRCAFYGNTALQGPKAW